jgi:transcriptional regulator with XRE-family HTH domain
MNFPAKLKELRQSRNLTEQQLADQIGISVKTYRNYESGKTKPKIAIFRKIVIALETTADELLEIK